MTGLAKERCIPCHGGVTPLTETEAQGLLAEVPRWRLAAEPSRIERGSGLRLSQPKAVAPWR